MAIPVDASPSDKSLEMRRVFGSIHAGRTWGEGEYRRNLKLRHY